MQVARHQVVVAEQPRAAEAEDRLLQDLAPMDRSQLYELAGLLLSELVPGWDEDLNDEDEDADEDEEDAGVVVVAEDVAEALVVDASYRACMQEAERYLVQCEGLEGDGGVVTGLRQHLHLARERQVRAAASQRLASGQLAPGQEAGHPAPGHLFVPEHPAPGPFAPGYPELDPLAPGYLAGHAPGLPGYFEDFPPGALLAHWQIAHPTGPSHRQRAPGYP